MLQMQPFAPVSHSAVPRSHTWLVMSVLHSRDGGRPHRRTELDAGPWTLPLRGMVHVARPRHSHESVLVARPRFQGGPGASPKVRSFTVTPMPLMRPESRGCTRPQGCPRDHNRASVVGGAGHDRFPRIIGELLYTPCPHSTPVTKDGSCR